MTQIAMPSQRETIDGRNGTTHHRAAALASPWGSTSTERGALDHLPSIGHLPQACVRLARDLEKSLADARQAPAGSTDALLDAVLLLNQAARKAVQLEELLATAQQIIDASPARAGR